MGLFGKKKTGNSVEQKSAAVAASAAASAGATQAAGATAEGVAKAAGDVDIRSAVLESLAAICEDEVVKEDPDINIVEEGLIDSLGYIELLMQIEEKTGVVIAPAEYSREQMDTPNKIVAIVVAKTNA
ncbi:MAG: D-alanine--poly(phosphoribitol) ligase subunit 2 [Lachnospiraceae bacterium]|nr:D-alanine--poly(phosphoribitol) ligase subunit 2 [Lachnospiraceae bacterium]